jgi:hypothetical protein
LLRFWFAVAQPYFSPTPSTPFTRDKKPTGFSRQVLVPRVAERGTFPRQIYDIANRLTAGYRLSRRRCGGRTAAISACHLDLGIGQYGTILAECCGTQFL